MLSLRGRRQKTIDTLNSARIGKDANKGWGEWGGERESWVMGRGLEE
jgi:hypothetical protein